MASPPIVPASTPIAQLNPGLRPDESSVTGIVTLIWPYASSKSTFGLLLVEPDFRLRSNRGQVRVHFQGSSAKAVARSGVSSGDQLLLSLRGAQWVNDATTAATPGRGFDRQLQYGERLVLQVRGPAAAPQNWYSVFPIRSSVPRNHLYPLILIIQHRRLSHRIRPRPQPGHHLSTHPQLENLSSMRRHGYLLLF